MSLSGLIAVGWLAFVSSAADRLPPSPTLVAADGDLGAQLRATMLRTARTDNPDLMVWVCAKGNVCEGIGDRLRGMMATFFMAMALGRRFGIWMSTDVSFTDVFEPNELNWSRGAPKCDERVRIWTPGLWKYTPADFQPGTRLFANRRTVCVHTNTHFGQHTIDIRPDLFGSVSMQAAFGLAFRFLFRLAPRLAVTVEMLRQQTGLPRFACFACATPGWSVVHFRAGMEYDPLRHDLSLITKAVKCVNQTLGNDLLYVASDRLAIKYRLASALEHTTYANIPISHVERTRNSTGHIYAWAEFVVLMHAHCIYASRSGYSEIAAMASTVPGHRRCVIAWWKSCTPAW